MNAEQAYVLIGAIVETWPTRGEPLSVTATEIQARALLPLDFDVALSAVEKLVTTSKFRPTLAEVIEQARLLAREKAPVCMRCGLRTDQCKQLGACLASPEHKPG